MSEQQQTVRPYKSLKFSDVLKKALHNIENRKHGRIKSFKTPWAGLNNASLGGLEWQSMITIGARPGAGKTMIVSQILRQSRLLNPDQDFGILEFQFEMAPEQYGARHFAAETAKDYGVILSSKQALDDYTFQLIEKLVKETEMLERKGVVRNFINEPMDHKEMVKAIHYFYNENGRKPLIVTIDHSWLLKKANDEREKIQTLYNTAEALMQVKKELPIIIIMITQLNRSIDEPSRKTPGSIMNYPTSSDIFGGDAFMQASEMVIVLANPLKADIPIYGPKEYICQKGDVFMHLLKIRNGNDDNNVLFMKTEFDKGQLVEVPEPNTNVSIANNGVSTFGNRRRGRAVSADIGEEL